MQLYLFRRSGKALTSYFDVKGYSFSALWWECMFVAYICRASQIARHLLFAVRSPEHIVSTPAGTCLRSCISVAFVISYILYISCICCSSVTSFLFSFLRRLASAILGFDVWDYDVWQPSGFIFLAGSCVRLRGYASAVGCLWQVYFVDYCCCWFLPSEFLFNHMPGSCFRLRVFASALSPPDTTVLNFLYLGGELPPPAGICLRCCIFVVWFINFPFVVVYRFLLQVLVTASGVLTLLFVCSIHCIWAIIDLVRCEC